MPASPGTLAPFPVHGMHCILNPVRGHSCPLLLGQLQAPTNFVNGRSRSPPLFFPSAAFNPARGPLYYVQSKEGKPAPVRVTWLPRLSAGRAAPHLQSATYLGQTTTTRPPGDQEKITRPPEAHLTTSTTFQRQLFEPLACGTLANMKTRLAANRRIG